MKISFKYVLISFLTITIVLFLSGCSPKYSKETDPHKYLTFVLQEDQTYMVTGFSGDFIRDVIIPGEHNEHPVTKISDYAFINSPSIPFFGRNFLPIETLIIEEGITHIGKSAFKDNGIHEISLPESLLHVAMEAFMGNGTIASLPSGLIHIGASAFSNTGLSGSIHIKNIYIEPWAFSGTKITDVIFEEGITEIPEHLFYKTLELKSVEFPNSLLTIKEGAFRLTPKLTHIDLPINLESIGPSAFWDSGLEVLDFNHSVDIGEKAFYENSNLTTVRFNHPKITMNMYSFGLNQQLNNVEFNDLELIKPEAFIGSSLSGMSISRTNPNYKMIDNAVSKQDNDLNYLILAPSNLTELTLFHHIGSYAYAGRMIDTLHIPTNIQTIEPYAFSTSIISNLIIDAKIIKSNAFYYADLGETIEISSKLIEKLGFANTSGFRILKLNEGVEHIEREAFVVNLELEKVYLPNSLKIIEMAAFLQCHNLKDVYYGLKEGTPADIYIGSFIIMKSNQLENNRIYAKIYEDFRIHVEPEMYDKIRIAWSRIPQDEFYIYEGSLTDHIVKYVS